MFRRLAALLVFGMTMAGGALGQALVCSIDNNFTGAFEGFAGNYTVVVNPNANATLRANCSSAINSYNWSPGNIPGSQIPVTVPGTPGSTAQYTLTGCIALSAVCAPAVTITIQVASTTAPDCSLTAAPNPALSGQTVTFTASCDSGLPPPVQINYIDLSGVPRSSSSLTFADTAPAVSLQTVRNVFYHPISAAAVRGVERVLQVAISPALAPGNCTLSAQPNPVVLGTSTVLTAACTGGGTATSYSFLDGNLNVIRTAASNTLVVTPPNLGNNTYFVRGINAAGQTTSPPYQVNVLPPPPSGCTVTATPNPIALGTSTTLTGQCAGGGTPDAYTFTYPDGTVVSGASRTLSVRPATIGTHTFTLVASNPGGSSSPPATVIVVVQAAACTVSASVPNPVLPNTPVTLIASCNNQPVGFAWSTSAGPIPGATAASVVVTPAVTTTYTITASSGSTNLPIIATGQYTVVVSSAAAIAPIAGATITGTPGRPLSRELQVRVTDRGGAPVAGELVNWSVVNPGPSPGTFAANPSPASDAQGIARNTFTMGNDAGGRTLRACLSSVSGQCADFQVLPGASRLVAIAGTPLVGVPGRPLSRELLVQAVDSQNVPVPQQSVGWSVVNPGSSPGSFAASTSAPTDAQGITRNTFTMGNDPGGRTLRACLAGQPSVCAGDFVVRSLNAALERPTAKIMSPLAELAVATPLAQLSNVRFRLEQLRLRRNPSVVEALRVSVAGHALPSFSAFALAPVDKNGKPVPQRGGGAAADDPFERLGVFVNGDAEFGRQSATGVQSGYDLRTRGLTIGADYRLPGDSVVGVAAGFMNANTDLAEGGGSQGARGYSISAYGSFVPAAGAYLDVIAHAGGNKYDTRRRELTDAGLPVDYNSNTRGNQYAFAISAGADFNRGPLTMNPYLRLDHVNATINRFSESGDDGAIQVGDLDLKNTVMTLGGQLSYAISTSWGVLMPNTRMELQRRVHGDGRNVSAQLVADGTVNTQVQLEAVDRNYGNFTLGVSAVLPRGVSGFANYERLFGREGYGNSKYTLGVRFEF